jgi:putative hydroxymethylpyrimidine transport system ATP-binding protein
VRGTARIGGAVLFGPLALELAPGGWTCLLGASGAGKSTALRLLAGLPTAAAFDGEVRAPARVAFMAQTDLLLPWANVMDNVVIGARLRGRAPDRARAAAVIEAVGLSGLADRRPGALSGGQRQRAALARTLMEDADLVLLDEPFSALDARTRADMQDLSARLLTGRTVLLVTHDPAEAARMGARILVLEKGRLHEAPPPPGSAPRPVDDPAMLAMQARLLTRLRAA